MPAQRLRLLSDAKARAVATEDYVTAKKIKAVEGELKTLGAQLAQLDMAKRVAVAVAEASCTTCKQVPVLRMVNTLNACESGVTLHDLALQVGVFLFGRHGIS